MKRQIRKLRLRELSSFHQVTQQLTDRSGIQTQLYLPWLPLGPFYTVACSSARHTATLRCLTEWRKEGAQEGRLPRAQVAWVDLILPSLRPMKPSAQNASVSLMAEPTWKSCSCPWVWLVIYGRPMRERSGAYEPGWWNYSAAHDT